MESDILFVQPSFIRGMSRTFDLWGTIDEYNSSLTPIEADRLALASDFCAISNDYREAFDKILEHYKTETETTDAE